MTAFRARNDIAAGLAVAFTALLVGCVSQPGAGRAEPRVPSAADRDRSTLDHLQLAGLYLSSGKTATALEEIKQVIAAKPDLARAYDLQGLIYAAQGDFTGSDASFQRALQLAPDDGGTRLNYGWTLCQQKRFEQADAQFALALTAPVNRDLGRTLFDRGVCQAGAGQWEDAERNLARAYELDPSNPVTAYNLGTVLLHRGELERARFYVARINASAQQANAQSLWLAARIEQRDGKTDAARALGRELIDRFPKSAEALRFEEGNFSE